MGKSVYSVILRSEVTVNLIAGVIARGAEILRFAQDDDFKRVAYQEC